MWKAEGGRSDPGCEWTVHHQHAARRHCQAHQRCWANSDTAHHTRGGQVFVGNFTMWILCGKFSLCVHFVGFTFRRLRAWQFSHALLSTTGSHSGPSSEKQSPMTQKHSPQPSPVALPNQGGPQPGQPALQPGQMAAQTGQAPAQSGQTPAQTSQAMIGPPASAAAQPVPAGTQQSPVTQPSGLPPQLYLHDGR